MGEGADPNPRFVADKLVETSALNMGATAEKLHNRWPELTKERADAYAAATQARYAAALAAGNIEPDLVAVATDSADGWGLATTAERPRSGPTVEGLHDLRTPFRPHGRVTAGNSSGLTDGATVCLLASAPPAEELALPIRMRMVIYAFAGVEPETMGT